MNGVDITIVDWAKFNPRADRANYSWFRLENTFFTKTFSWGSERQRLFLYLCSCASQGNRAEFTLDIELAFTLLKRKSAQVLSDLKHLSSLGVITTADCRLNDGIEPSSLPATYERNVTNERTNDIGQNKFDLESLYFLYPRKVKKKKGIEKLKVVIKDQETFDAVKKSILNYSAYCSKHVVEPRYIMYFTTFVNSWEDYIDPIIETKIDNNRFDIKEVLARTQNGRV